MSNPRSDWTETDELVDTIGFRVLAVCALITITVIEKNKIA